MARLLCTSSFRESLKLLTKRPNLGYSACADDIRHDFSKKSLDDIYGQHYLVTQRGQARIIKARIKNPLLNTGAAGGYRVIFICNLKRSHAALLTVYPKKGKYSKTDLTEAEYRELLQTYIEEIDSLEVFLDE